MKWIADLFNIFFSDFKNIENWTSDIDLNWILTLKYDSKNTFYDICIECQYVQEFCAWMCVHECVCVCVCGCMLWEHHSDIHTHPIAITFTFTHYTDSYSHNPHSQSHPLSHTYSHSHSHSHSQPSITTTLTHSKFEPETNWEQKDMSFHLIN